MTSRGLALVADDLTGAADAAAPFAARGAEVGVVLNWPPPEGLDVIALVTDSRWRDSETASTRMRHEVRRARAWGADRLFLKVDSTLRGHVSVEVAAAMETWGSEQVVATPAFPAQGRVVRDGVLYVHGVRQRHSVASAFPEGVTVLDASDDEDLLALARQVLLSDAVAVGSAGLASALARALEPRAPKRRRPSTAVTGVLVVVGATHSASRAQAAVLLEAGVLCVVVSPGAPSLIEPAVDELTRGGRVLLTTDPAPDAGGDSPRAQVVAAQVAAVVQELLDRAPGAGLVVTGGSTALAVATALGADCLRLLDEVGPGVALGELLLRDRPLAAITKSGGFGCPEALLRAVELLEECA